MYIHKLSVQIGSLGEAVIISLHQKLFDSAILFLCCKDSSKGDSDYAIIILFQVVLDIILIMNLLLHLEVSGKCQNT